MKKENSVGHPVEFLEMKPTTYFTAMALKTRIFNALTEQKFPVV